VVKYGVPLDGLTKAIFSSEQECALMDCLLARLPSLPKPDLYVAGWMGEAKSRQFLDEAAAYFEACANAGAILKPPYLPFD